MDIAANLRIENCLERKNKKLAIGNKALKTKAPNPYLGSVIVTNQDVRQDMMVMYKKTFDHTLSAVFLIRATPTKTRDDSTNIKII